MTASIGGEAAARLTELSDRSGHEPGDRLPLSGVRVLDLSALLPGPYTTMILGDFGADVLKVERPGAGDGGRTSDPRVEGSSVRHRMINRNKRSVALDLKDPTDRTRFADLVLSADVLVEGFRPGVMDRLGFGSEQLRVQNPRLIYCSISGFGASGPRRTQPGHDLNFMSLAGLLDVPNGVPAPVPSTQYADLVGGSLRAVIGILLALRAREHDGLGQFVDVSMAAGAMALQVERLAFHNAGQPTAPATTRLTGRYPCYQLYATSDGRYLAVAATEEKFWVNLCTAIGAEELISLQYAVGEDGRAAKDKLGALLASRSLAEWQQRLAGIDTCCTPVLTFEEALADARETDPELFWDTEHGAQFSGLVPLSRTMAQLRRPAPDLGSAGGGWAHEDGHH